MKKFFIFILMILCASPFYAQDQKFIVGADFLSNLTSLRGAVGYYKYSSRIEIGGGFHIEYLVNPEFAFTAGLYYECKGANTSILTLDDSAAFIGYTDIIKEMDYLVLPVTGKIIFPVNKVNCFVNFGMYLGFLYNARDLYGAVDIIPSRIIDNNDHTEKLDLGIIVGAGVDIPLTSRIAAGIEIRDNLGIKRTDKQDYLGDLKTKTNSLALMIGIKFKIL